MKDLTLMVRGREDYSHNPLLLYSLSNLTPDMSDSGDISCGVNGHDFCVIPENQIKEGEIIYLGVFCLSSCKFDIVVVYETVF